MQTVMVYAYVNNNLGDDLFIRILCERYPNTKFVLHAPSEYKCNFKELDNITIHRSDSLISRGVDYLFRLFDTDYSFTHLLSRQCDAVVNIGGSIFMQQDDWIKKWKLRSKITTRPFFLLGANFGPYYNKEYYLKHKELFKGYTDICFREQYSYDLFKDLDNVRKADDVIFLLGKEKIDVHQQEDNIVISVIKPSVRKHLASFDSIYYKKIRDLSVYFIKKGYKVILISFCENEGDKEAINAITNIIPKEYTSRVTKHLYSGNIEETLNIIQTCTFVVGTRFHAMILGWVYNKPVFPIAYSEKMTNVMKDINFNGLYTNFDNIHKLDVKKVFNSMNTNLIDVSKQVISAEDHFSKLDKYLFK